MNNREEARSLAPVTPGHFVHDGPPATAGLWSRRALLAAVPAVLVACATTRSDETSRDASGRAGTTTRAGATLEPSPPATPGSPPATDPPPATPAPVDRAAVAARYHGVTPTRWGTDLPGLVASVPATVAGPRLALTFDACGGPRGSGVDTALIDLLTREKIPATLFLNQRWIDANRRVVDALMANPLFELANHGTRHVPLSVTGRAAYRIKGTASPQEVVDEVGANQDHMTQLVGRSPRWFRSGTAYYDDVAVRIVSDLAVAPVGFAVNGDAGGTAPAAKVATALTGAPDRSVVLMHMNRPTGATRQGLATALPLLRQRGVQFVTLTGPH